MRVFRRQWPTHLVLDRSSRSEVLLKLHFKLFFQYYNKWFALIASFLCVVIMFIANWWAALVTFVCIAALYKWIDHRDVDVNWGSTGPAYTYMRVRKASEDI